ncbi:MAG: RidA family protein [Clostridia bacterium]|nr:RidA family protein [Clostridia bacterium]
MADVYEKLRELKVELPSPPPKGGVYTPVMEFGTKLLYCSGCGPALSDGSNVIGKVGRDLTLEQGQKAAYNCMLNLLANLDAYLGGEAGGGLNRIKRCVKVLGFVNSADDFTQQPQVVNGGSNLLLSVLGEEKGLPARTAIGVNATPGGIACEIEMLVEYE